MTTEEITQLAQKFHTPGDIIKKNWHPEYRKELEKKLMNKYSNNGRNKRVTL